MFNCSPLAWLQGLDLTRAVRESRKDRHMETQKSLGWGGLGSLMEKASGAQNVYCTQWNGEVGLLPTAESRGQG